MSNGMVPVREVWQMSSLTTPVVQFNAGVVGQCE